MASSSPRIRSAVSFSEYSQLVFIPNENDMVDKKWYSSQDHWRLQQQMTRDVRRMVTLLRETDANDLTEEQLYGCIGTELFLTEGARATAEARRNHIVTVLSEQRRQRQQGVHDAEKLSEISMRLSRHAIEKSQKLAEGYSKLLNENEN